MDNAVKGLYIGTMNLISSSLTGDDKVEFKKLRHTFLKIQVESTMTGFVKKEGMQYVQIGKEIYALGESASKLAFVTGKKVGRAIHNGTLDPREEKAEIIFKMLIEALIGKAEHHDSACYFTVPAETSEREHSVIYHTEILSAILRGLGYRAQAVNEGLALVYSSLAASSFTGIAISFGGGLLNVCAAHKAKVVEAFSIDRGGDWIDENVAKVLALPVRDITAVKEKGIDLDQAETRIEKAIAIYYKELIRYAIETIRTRFQGNKKIAVFKGPVDIVLAGAVALPVGFVPLFKSELAKVEFPLEIGQIILAKDPEYAIASGCLIGTMTGKGVA